MEKLLYTCQFCQKEFEPTRRKVQKFCSATCRSKNYYHQKNKSKDNKSPIEILHEAVEVNQNKKTTVDEMSLSGVGNVVAGNLIFAGANKLAKTFQSKQNKPATKGDLVILEQQLNKRYSPVINVTNRFGSKAFYDKELFKIVFYNEQLNKFELPMMDL